MIEGNTPVVRIPFLDTLSKESLFYLSGFDKILPAYDDILKRKKAVELCQE